MMIGLVFVLALLLWLLWGWLSNSILRLLH